MASEVADAQTESPRDASGDDEEVLEQATIPDVIGAIANWLYKKELLYRCYKPGGYLVEYADGLKVVLRVSEAGVLAVEVVFTTRMPAHRRMEAAEFFCKLNYKLRVGHFDMDPEDGELRYSCSSACLSLQVEDLPDQVNTMWEYGRDMFALHETVVKDMAETDMTAEQAFDRVYASVTSSRGDSGS